MPWFLLPLLVPAAGQSSGPVVTLVRGGKAQAAIVLPANPSPATRHGAAELQRFLREMSGAELPVQAEGQSKRPPAGIFLRQDPALAEEEYRVRTEPGKVILAGGGKRGTLYGCYALLEDALGCRWFTPRISRIPKRPTISVGPLDLHGRPAFEYRYPYYTEAFDPDWSVRNRTNGCERLDDSLGGKVTYGKFVHTFSDIIAPKDYYATHPEYFSLVDGKRQDGYAQLCLTNPDVLRITIETVRRWIREHPEATIFSVSQNDTYKNCQCDNCRAVDKEEGAPSGLMLRFVNQVADAIAKEAPRVLIDTLAYQWTEDPPKLARPRPNVRIRLAPIGACFGHALDGCDANRAAFANLQAWAKITDQLYVWHYSTNFANYLQPLPDLDEIAADIPLFKKTGVVGLFYEGDYAPGGGGEMAELKSYLMAKLMWDPARDSKPVIAEFLQGVYGPAAPAIRQWLDLLHAPVRTKRVDARIYDPPTAPYLSDATLAQGVQLFDAAEKAAAADPVALDQVQRARLALEYVQLMRAPAGTPQRDALARGVAAKIRKYGIGQVREGEPVERFLERILPASP